MPNFLIEKYPEIKQLMGPDHNLKYIVILLVAFQLISTYYISQLSYPWVLVLAYCLGGTINHSLTLAVHEISHNLAFGHSHPLANRLFGIFANLPLIAPMSISFKKYHLEHHRYMGIDVIDIDIPTKFEGIFFSNRPLKVLWVVLQPFFYTLRPFFVNPKNPSLLEALNITVQLTFDAVMVYFWGIKPNRLLGWRFVACHGSSSGCRTLHIGALHV